MKSLAIVTAAVALAGAGGAIIKFGGLMACGTCSIPESSPILASVPVTPALATTDERVAAKASASATYEVDPVHSSVHFQIRHAGIANFYGRFNTFSGAITLDPENPASSSLSFTVDTASVDTNNQGRDDHLRNPDFFNARQFPQATFTSTSFTPGTDDDLWTVEGNLSLHGETKPVTVTLTWLGTGSMRGTTIGAYEATFTFKRSDFGMTTYLADDGGEGGGLGNTVRMLVSVEAKRQ